MSEDESFIERGVPPSPDEFHAASVERLDERARGACCDEFRRRIYDAGSSGWRGQPGASFVMDERAGWELVDDSEQTCFAINFCPFCGACKVWSELRERLEAVAAAGGGDGR